MKSSNFRQKLHSIIASFTVAVVLFLSLFGLSLSINLMTSGEMMDCQFMQESASMCPMNLIDHIQAWQNTLIATLTNNTIFSLIVVAVILTFVYVKQASRLKASEYYYYKNKNSLLNSYLPLRLAFARGRINPKIY